MTARQLHDRILVQRIDEGEQKVGGIIISRHREGKAATGQGRRGRVMARPKTMVSASRSTCKRGNRILFGKYSGQEIKLDGNEYLIMREDDVLAVLEEGDIKKTKTKTKN